MSSNLRKPVLSSLGWCAACVLVVGALLGGALIRLNSRRARVAGQELEIVNKRDQLDRHDESLQGALHSLEEALLESAQLTASESRRIAELSGVARKTGVKLLAMRSIEAPENEEGPTLRRTHEIMGQGTYRQIAEFLDGLYASRGMASVDKFKIERDDADPVHLLRASLAVAWHAQNPNAGESQETP